MKFDMNNEQLKKENNIWEQSNQSKTNQTVQNLFLIAQTCGH